ncbi:MAG TPA: NAD-dependent deacylase [Bacteroidales bacterium]|nr:NAD-dependent deacylase [Bacteroidales bacterium]
MENLSRAAQLIKSSKFLTAFTGAGISKESGIPVFRGGDGVYSKYDHSLLEIRNYKMRTEESWKAVKAIFYDFFGSAKPNAAHKVLADWEKSGLLKYVITQNIDNLHQDGGSKNVIEYHGTKDGFVCLKCGKTYRLKELNLTDKPPYCSECDGLLKPDFVFFGEAIPQKAARLSYDVAKKSDVHLVIGTTGEVQPASYIPYYAKRAGAMIIEINPEKSKFTDTITDIYLKGKAGEILVDLNNHLNEQ